MNATHLFKWFICTGMLGLLAACTKKAVPPSSGNTTPILQVSENTVSPGDQLIIISPEFSGLSKENFTVSFDKTQVAITAFDAKTILKVPVPLLEEGEHLLNVKKDGKEIGSAKLKFRRAPCLQLLFTYTSGQVILKKQMPYAGMFRQYTGLEGRVLSFEVQDMKNQLLATGTVAHPLSETEVFEEKGIKRVKTDKNFSASFQLNIPNFPKPFKVVIYDMEDVITTTETLKNRKKIYEQNIN